METVFKEKLSGRKAVVSGGHSGIGLRIVRALQQAGVQTAIADISPAPPLPSPVVSCPCDIIRAGDTDQFYAQVRHTMGIPDILIFNAGQGLHEKLTDGDPEKWRQVIALNLMGALRLVRAFVPGMLEAGNGDVIFISSVAAGKAYPYGGIYAATKAALETVAETLRLEVLPDVRVTTIAPGLPDTAFFENTRSGPRSAGDIGCGALDPERVAQTVLFALGQPRQVSVNQITIRPASQPF